ncbi:MAG TPA: GntR family transcriptional regulator [Fimbriimonas sp.]|nr:GntR family transcriptional regulator [Fimbriimonas sp.]
MADSRWQGIAEKYRSDIESGRLGPGDRLPSDAALSELLGVSRATAHRALAELQRWGLVTRLRGSGTVVASRDKRSKGLIALIVDQVAHQRDFPRADLIGGIHEGLGDDINLLWCDSKLNVDREIRFLETMPNEVDGILCWPTGNPRSTAVLRELAQANFPIVLLDRVPDDLEINATTHDSAASSRHALEFLIDRGHSRIAFFAFNKPNVSTVVERLSTFETVFHERGWSPSSLTRLFAAELEFGESNRFVQAVHDAFFTLIKADEPITAVFCVQDMFAAAVMECAEHLGVSIPNDLEIVTYNDWPSMMLRRPWQAHRIVPRTYELGRAAASRLLSLVNGERPEPLVQRISADFVVADAGLLPTSSLAADGERTPSRRP